MRLRRYAALAGALVLTLGVAGAVYADSGSPTSVNATVDGLTVTVSGTWAWNTAACAGRTRAIMGWAVAWGEPGWTSNPVPKSGGGSFFMGDASQGNKVSTNLDPCTNTTGSWGPLSHTYAASGQYDVCVILYDLRKSDIGDPAGAHNDLAGGPNRNRDNSVEENFLEGQSVCLSPEFPVVVKGQPAIHIQKTPSVTTLPAGGGSVTYTYVVTNTGDVPVFDVVVTDDKCAPVTGPTGDAGADGTLGLTETWTYTCSTTLTVTTTNVVTATAVWDDCNDNCHQPVTPATDTATVTVAPVVVGPQPGISIDKTAEPATLLAEGGPVTYSYAVANIGYVPLIDIVVTDDNGTPTNTSDDWTATCPKTTLAVGESMVCSANVEITTTTTNVAVVTAAWDDCNDGCHRAITPASDTATVNVGDAGVQGATDIPTLPPTDASTDSTGTGSNGGLALLLLVLGVIGVGAVTLTPARARARR